MVRFMWKKKRKKKKMTNKKCKNEIEITSQKQECGYSLDTKSMLSLKYMYAYHIFLPENVSLLAIYVVLTVIQTSTHSLLHQEITPNLMSFILLAYSTEVKSKLG